MRILRTVLCLSLLTLTLAHSVSAQTPWQLNGPQSADFYGFSVATAGDVDGDGYSDVIVGAPRFHILQSDRGRAFIYRGSAGGPVTPAAWVVTGEQADEGFGISVATAGDVNGDGYTDVIVGADSYDLDRLPDVGKAYLYLGKASGLSTTPAWTAVGEDVGAYFGHSVATAGDVNGDGYADVIIGAYGQDTGQVDAGRAYVYLGSPTGLSASPVWVGASNQASAYFGYSVGTAGDVNGDGYADIIVGAPSNPDPGFASACIYYGSATGPLPAPAWTVAGTAPNFGESVATAGDVNGDGYADVIVGAYPSSDPPSATGHTFVFMGAPSGPSTTASWGVVGDPGATAGDTNGDGYADVIVGLPFLDDPENDEGATRAFLGGPTGLSITPLWTAEVNLPASYLGVSVAAAGDVNGDGFADMIAGAHYFDSGVALGGAAFVYAGSAAGPATTAGWTAHSDLSGGVLGSAVACAGDVNGDGFSDVLVGGFWSNFATAALFLGSGAGPGTSPDWTARGPQPGDDFGFSLASAGDVNGDGYSDVIVGAPSFDVPGGPTLVGRAYVFLGSPSGLGSAAAWFRRGETAGEESGASVACAGDVNGDGYSDVIVGAPGYSIPGGPSLGKAYLFLGSPSGLQSAPAWTGTGSVANEQFGLSVAGAGDVNGDGYSDVVIAPHYVFLGSPGGLVGPQLLAINGYRVAGAGDVNGDGYSDILFGDLSSNGRAVVYRGSPSGPVDPPDWAVVGDGIADGFGSSLASAGDVNGDGYSDVIVGAPYFPTGLERGRAKAYLGSGGGLSTTAVWVVEGDQALTRFGWSVSSAGDVDGDGYSDIVVGAPFDDVAQSNDGRVSLFYGNGGHGLGPVPRQRTPADSSPVALLGEPIQNGVAYDAIRLNAVGRSAAGRARVRLEWEVKPLGTAFDGVTSKGPLLTTGSGGGPGSTVALTGVTTDLAANQPYHWRLRTLSDSPFFPRSPWVSPSLNSPTEADFRAGSTHLVVGVSEPGPAPAVELRIEQIRPNPSSSHASVRYALPQANRVRLTLHDLQGREVARLVDGMEGAGPHEVAWDGRDAGGSRSRAGVYWVRLQSGDRSIARKLVRE